MGAQLDTGSRKKGVTPNINVTPLVDVVLVLLIIFMVVLPNMQDHKAIDIIKVEKADKTTEDAEPLVITIDAREVYTLGEDDMSREAVLSQLARSVVDEPSRRVLLRADSTLPYKTVREFFNELQQLGYQKIALAVGVSREWSEGEG